MEAGVADGGDENVLRGLAASPGLADAPAFVFGADVAASVPDDETVSAERTPDELARFETARLDARGQVEKLADQLRAKGLDGADVFDNHLALYDDPVVGDAVGRAIRESRLTARSAVKRVLGEYRETFSRMQNAYLRERARDVDDMEDRLLRVLEHRDESPFAGLTRPSVVVAEDLTPSETAALPRGLVRGFVTVRGSVTSHSALLARALGIPAVVGLGDAAARIGPGDRLLLDGDAGTVAVNPDAAAAAAFGARLRQAHDLAVRLAAETAGGGALKDGTPVALEANVQPGVSFDGLAATGAQGIGLYRSEYLWLNGSGGEPSEDVQTAAYTEAARAASELGPSARAAIRVLDIGGDKLARGQIAREANPFLGNRSIRWLLSHRDAFRTQVRAILRASASGPVSLLWPMVASIDELRAANAELAAAQDDLRAQGIPFDEKMPRGCMIEIPSAALIAGQLAREADFFSVGTNDLIQYTLAADRGNADVAYLYQPTHPAVIRLLDMTFAAARAAGIPAVVCGQTASDPVLAALWVGLGATGLSMDAAAIPSVRRTLLTLATADVRALADEARALCATASAADILARCRAFLSAR